jgi:acylphosphatase
VTFVVYRKRPAGPEAGRSKGEVRILQGETEGRERAHVYVSGRVQGVFFRDAARQEARRLGLSGWASNLSDGRVEAAFEGESSSVRQMIRWCEEGSPEASVESVETEFEEPRGDSGGFEVS